MNQLSSYAIPAIRFSAVSACLTRPQGKTKAVLAPHCLFCMQDYLFPSEVKLRQAQVPGSIHVFSDGFRLVNDDVLVPTETTAYNPPRSGRSGVRPRPSSSSSAPDPVSPFPSPPEGVRHGASLALATSEAALHAVRLAATAAAMAADNAERAAGGTLRRRGSTAWCPASCARGPRSGSSQWSSRRRSTPRASPR